MNGSWIKLYRELSEWEWFTSSKHVHLFIYFLMRANHKPKKYRGELIPAGSFTTSLSAISDATGLSVRKIRTVLKDLKTTNEVTSSTNAKRTMITILNWSDYQGGDTVNDKRATSKRQANDSQTTTNKNDKNDKNEKKYNIYTQKILDLWNAQKIINHNSTDPNLSKISKQLDKRLKKNSIEEILEAVENYGKTVSSEATFFNYRWPLWTFLQREGSNQFYPEAFVFENYLTGSNASFAKSTASDFDSVREAFLNG